MALPRVLVVDDNEADVRLLQEAFSAAALACEMTSISDGGQALEFVERSGCVDGPAPTDLIFLDINLPKIGGLAIVEAARRNPFLARVPIVVMTSAEAPNARERAERGGADRFLVKPNDLDEFLKIGVIARELVEQRAAAATPKPAVSAGCGPKANQAGNG